MEKGRLGSRMWGRVPHLGRPSNQKGGWNCGQKKLAWWEGRGVCVRMSDGSPWRHLNRGVACLGFDLEGVSHTQLAGEWSRDTAIPVESPTGPYQVKYVVVLGPGYSAHGPQSQINEMLCLYLHQPVEVPCSLICQSPRPCSEWMNGWMVRAPSSV